MKALGILSLLLVTTSAKVFERCELAQILKKNGLDGHNGYSLANWVCMVDCESGFNTMTTRSYRNTGIVTSTNYGIFQINNKKWCKDSTSTFTYNLCNIDCSCLTNDDITDDIQCVKKVVGTQLGMDIWTGWKRTCRGRDVDQLLKGCTL